MMAALEFRPAVLDDVEFYTDVSSLVRPFDPLDPVVERYWWLNPDDNWEQQRFVVSRSGTPIGVATCGHPRWAIAPRRFGGVNGHLLMEHRDAATLAAILREMESRLVADGATTIAVRANEDDAILIAAIVERGFHEDRRGRRWVLDLVAHRERILAMTAECRARMTEQGVRLLTLADDADPEKYRKVCEISNEAEHDIPSTLPHIEGTLDDYLRWFRAPNIREDRFWIAREDDRIVGVSLLGYPPVRGAVGTEWTATARSVRGRGIARAVKCETLAQAIALGVDSVRTGNDAANDPILHINATMGYQPAVGSINYLKEA
jgi:hypothetical protein